MCKQGSFGYKIGKKTRLMYIQNDADLLWQICVREIYVLINHYGSLAELKKAFENLKEAKNKPKQEVIEKCKPYTELTISNQLIEDWSKLTRHCQHSFINILDSGYFLNNGNDIGLVFILDFNTQTVQLYSKGFEKKVTEHEKATIEELMGFDDMPTKSYAEILSNTKERYEKFSNNCKNVDDEIKKIKSIIEKAKEMGGEQNIIQKAKILLDDMEWERKKLEMEYRYFYHRMNDLNLIDHS
jgi:hypothetical protein